MNKIFSFNSFLFILIILPFSGWSQSITGKVIDGKKKPLEFAAVSIINPKDSILISYASTDAYGKFELKNIEGEEVLFQIHLLGFNTYQKTIIYNNKSMVIEDVTLQDANTLNEITITAIVPIIIKKDTVSYNAKAFKIRTDDSVEDLLKKLPGVEVDASGKVTAQGESISKIYVDGKEFFSGDPAIATKNLSADAIKKIEVIDEKSETSRVSGVNDDERKKVINLTLKDDKKVNDFGKVQGGYGTDDRYLTSLNYNRFSSKLQTSIIGKFNNVNTTGSDISEVMIFNPNNGRRGNSSSASSGFVTTGIGGLNLGYEIKKDQNINADYFYNYTKNTSGDVTSIRTEYILGQEILSETRSRSENTSNSNVMNFNYADRSKKLSSLYINGTGNYSKNNGNSINTLDKYNGLGELDLQSIGKSFNKSTNSNGNVSFDYTQKFKEGKKRYITSSGGISASNSDGVRNNTQLNKFNVSDPNNETEVKEETVRDQKVDNLNLNIELQYTEPLTENHLLEIRGGIAYRDNIDDVNQSKYENDVIQNPLIYKQLYKQNDLSAGLRYKYDREKFTLSAGATILEQTQNIGLENEVSFKKKYTNFNPNMYIRYRPKRGKFMRLRVRKSVTLPGLSQLTPVVNDFNPLFISKGNPNLTPEDKYALSAIYLVHNFASGFSLFSRISYNYIDNSIINTETTDAFGIRYSSFDNLGDKNEFNLNFRFGNRLKSLGLRYNINLNAGYNEYLTLINDEVNETQSKNGVLGLSLENNKKDKVDASIGASWNKNYTSFTSGNNADRDFLQQTYYAKVDWNITNRINVNSQFKYDIYTDSNFGTNQVVPIWNASLSYALLPSKSLTVMVTALDILNKNIGIIRTSSDNYFEETFKDVLGNYYMLSLTYNLNGNKNPNANKSRRRGHHF